MSSAVDCILELDIIRSLFFLKKCYEIIELRYEIKFLIYKSHIRKVRPETLDPRPFLQVRPRTRDPRP